MGFNRRVLIVDDMTAMRTIVKKMLRNMGCTDIEDADDGTVAWEKLQHAYDSNKPFEFILSDWNMPNMTGLELLKKVRSDERFKSLPFLLVTAEGESENVVAAVKLGVSSYVVKPFNAQTLTDKINTVLKRAS